MLKPFITNLKATLNCLFSVLLLAMLVGFSMRVDAAMLSPGTTPITNQATATYSPQGSTGIVTVLSNTVVANVAAVESITLVQNQQIVSSAGASITFTHTLTNTGNISTHVSLSPSSLSGFNLGNLKIIQDLNGNNVADPGEPEIKPGDLIPLVPGQAVTLIITGTIPASVNAGDQSKTKLSATATAGASDSVEDTINIPGAQEAPKLNLEKTVSKSAVSIGETVAYSIQIANPTNNPSVDGITVEDIVPLGFSYVAGSSRLQDAPIADPVSPSNRKLTFVIGKLDAGQSVTLTYQLQVGAAAGNGDGVNTALAKGNANGQVVSSNVDHAKVSIDSSVFDTSALIIGKVFVDCNRDDLQGKEELGIPGVRLYLDNGNYVITDEEGKFSFYGLKPRTYTLKLDRITLPPGAEMATVSNRNAGDPQSRFVDLKNGEMHRADFAEASCTPEIISAVKKRRAAAGEVRNARIEDGSDIQSDPLLQPLATTAAAAIDARSRPAAGTVDGSGKVVAEQPLLGLTRDRDTPPSLSDAPLARTPSVNLENVLPKLKGNAFGFLDLKDGDTLPGTDLAVRIVGRQGSTFKLIVNDEEIPMSRVGQRARMPSRDLQAWEYIGIKLKPGQNKLRAENVDDFGNKRDVVEIVLTAPGTPGKLQLVMPPDGAVADGQTPARILVRLSDANGVPVTARTLVTLESSTGSWDVEDLDPNQPGVQTFIQGGEALFDLIPPASPGTAMLRVSSGMIQADGRLALNPYLRPLIASGVIEGALSLNKLGNKSVQPATAADGFEEEIKNLNSDGTNAGIRGSMFLKGKVKGKYLLTLAYDSDKDTNGRLFRDIDPENYYPIYGDSSVKGFDAQSTSKLYVRIDKGRSYLLYGDFNTNAVPTPGRKLSNYSRSLTGVQQHYENDHVSINLFASNDSSRQQTTEFRAQGISGPYQLPVNGFIQNSEKIEIIVRSLNQPSLVLSTKAMNRFVDYTIDTLKGSIIFTEPVRGIDSDNNPVYIRVTWEVDNGGDKFWVYGADGVYHLNQYLDLGASAVRDNDPSAGYTLYGANATLNVSDATQATLEVARSEDDLQGDGNAWRAEVTRAGQGVEGRIYAGQTDGGFNNPNGGMTSGAREVGIKGGLMLNSKLRLGAEGLYSDSASTGGGVRQGIFSNLEYALMPNLKARLGVRYTQQDASAVASTAAPGTSPGQIADSDVTSINSKLSWSPESLSKVALFTEYEQSVNAASERMLGVGGTYQISDRSRLYARHQFITSTSGPFGLSELAENQNSTAIGLDYDYMKNGSAFSEYRIRDAIDGEQAQAALGLRNGWNLKPGVKLTTQFERQQPLSYSPSSEQSTAISLGVQYTADPLMKMGSRLEWRSSSSQTSILNTVAIARKLSLDWSILGKNTLSWTDTGASSIDVGGLSMSGPVIRDRFRVGAAWRQTDSNRWAWLGLYETRYDRDPDSNTSRTAHILSSNVNYQPGRQLILSGRYAAKLVNERNAGIRNDFGAHLVSGRAMFDVTEKWDAGLNVSTVIDGSSLQYGLGVEAGYLMTSNLWLSAGYNVFGYEDRDFDNSNSTRTGPYVRLRFKFDEEMFRWLE